MFINCPFCHALVATNPATDEPPPACPRCAAVLREATPASEGAPAASPQGTSASLARTSEADAAMPGAQDVQSPPGWQGDVGRSQPDPPDPQRPTQATPTQPTDVELPEPAAAAEVDTLLGDPPLDSRIVDPRIVDPPGGSAPRGIAAAGAGSRVPVLAALLRRGPAATTPPAPAPPLAEPVAPDAVSPVAPPAVAPPVALPVGPPVSPPVAPPVAPPAVAPSAIAPVEPPDPAHVAAPAPAAPSFVPRVTHRAGPRGWLLPIVAACLLVILATQWLLAERDRLGADARWRPLVLQACSLWRCTVAPWREPAALVLLDRDVRAHPTIPGALRVTASFRNDARWAQRWPRLVLALSDVEGREIGSRAFLPAEYLRGRPPAAGLGSGRTAIVRLDVVEPSPRVVAFAFEFR